MAKTRVLRKRAKQRRNSNASRLHPVSNFKTPPSGARFLELSGAPKQFAPSLSLGVTYNVRGQPSPLNHLLAGRLKGAKYANQKYDRLAVEPEQLQLPASPDKSQLLMAGQCTTPEAGTILKQLKENIEISPYVRNYLERKLMEKLQKTDADKRLLPLINFGQLELVYNFNQEPEGPADEHDDEELYKTVGQVDTPAPSIRSQPKTVKRTKVPLKVGATATKLISSIDMRKANRTLKTRLADQRCAPSHTYFTRNRAMVAKETVNLASALERSSPVSTLSAADFFGRQLTSRKGSSLRTTATKTRTIGNASKAKVVVPTSAAKPLVATKQSTTTRKSSVVRPSGKTVTSKIQQMK